MANPTPHILYSPPTLSPHFSTRLFFSSFLLMFQCSLAFTSYYTIFSAGVKLQGIICYTI